MIPDATVIVLIRERAKEAQGIEHKTCFFENFAAEGVFCRFHVVDEAAGEVKETTGGLMEALDEKKFVIVIKDECSDSSGGVDVEVKVARSAHEETGMARRERAIPAARAKGEQSFGKISIHG